MEEILEFLEKAAVAGQNVTTVLGPQVACNIRQLSSVCVIMHHRMFKLLSLFVNHVFML